MATTNPNDGQISRAEAHRMQTEFIANQCNYINTAMARIEPGYSDNRDFFFPYDKIENYLSYVRQYVSDNGIQLGELGLRIYLGAAVRDNGVLPKTHLFLVPTNDGIDMPGVNVLDYGEWGKPPSIFVP